MRFRFPRRRHAITIAMAASVTTQKIEPTDALSHPHHRPRDDRLHPVSRPLRSPPRGVPRRLPGADPDPPLRRGCHALRLHPPTIGGCQVRADRHRQRLTGRHQRGFAQVERPRLRGHQCPRMPMLRERPMRRLRHRSTVHSERPTPVTKASYPTTLRLEKPPKRKPNGHLSARITGSLHSWTGRID